MKTITHFLKWDCSDPGFRGQKATVKLRNFINKIVPLKGRPYVLSNPGVTLPYINGNAETIKDNWENIHILIQAAGIVLIIIVQHEECLAYQLRYGKLSPKREAREQYQDMKKAKVILEEKHPGIKVILIYGHLTNKGKREFVFFQII